MIYTTGFKVYGLGHIISLLLCVTLISLTYIYKDFLKEHKKLEKTIRYVFLILYFGNEIALYIWSYKTGHIFYETFPLELCGISLYLTCFYLITKSERIFKLIFPIAVVGEC